MPIDYFEYLSDDEGARVADFLLDMIRVEETIGSLIVSYYAHPDRRDEFNRMFVQRQTIGRRLELLKPILAADDNGKALHAKLRDLVELRNTIAHSMPVFSYRSELTDDPYDPGEEYREYHVGDKVIEAIELDLYSVMAMKAAAALAAFRSDVPSPQPPAVT